MFFVEEGKGSNGQQRGKQGRLRIVSSSALAPVFESNVDLGDVWEFLFSKKFNTYLSSWRGTITEPSQLRKEICGLCNAEDQNIRE